MSFITIETHLEDGVRAEIVFNVYADGPAIDDPIVWEFDRLTFSAVCDISVETKNLEVTIKDENEAARLVDVDALAEEATSKYDLTADLADAADLWNKQQKEG